MLGPRQVRLSHWQTIVSYFWNPQDTHICVSKAKRWAFASWLPVAPFIVQSSIITSQELDQGGP